MDNGEEKKKKRNRTRFVWQKGDIKIEKPKKKEK